MKIIARKVKAKELKAGDLFSTLGQDFWDNHAKYHIGAVGEKIYIRTEEPSPSDQEDEIVYRIDIIGKQRYNFLSAQIVPVETGIVIKWECENIGFGQTEICHNRVDREAMSNDFIIALFEYLEKQENK